MRFRNCGLGNTRSANSFLTCVNQRICGALCEVGVFLYIERESDFVREPKYDRLVVPANYTATRTYFQQSLWRVAANPENLDA